MAIGLKVIINKEQKRRVIAAAHEIQKDLNKATTSDKGVIKQCADEYTWALRKNMIGGKFNSSFPALSKKYKELKAKYTGNNSPWFWLLTESVFKNLKVWRGGKGVYYSGLKKNSSPTHTNFSKNVMTQTKGTWYATIIELGHRVVGNKKRPLFNWTWTEDVRDKCISKCLEYFNGVPKLWRAKK